MTSKTPWDSRKSDIRKLQNELEGLRKSNEAYRKDVEYLMKQSEKFAGIEEVLNQRRRDSITYQQRVNAIEKERKETISRLEEEVANLNKALVSRVTVETKVEESGKKVAETEEKIVKVENERSSQLAELIELQRDAIEENQRFKDGLMEVKRQMLDVTNVTKGMNDSWFQSMSKSRAWTAASRLLSGTGLWSIQNAIRGVIDVVSIYQTAQEQQMEANNRAAKAMENFAETYDDYMVKSAPVKERMKEINKQMDKMGKLKKGTLEFEQADAELERRINLLKVENMSFKLAKERGMTDEQALETLQNELDSMDELIQRQQKAIFGSRFKKEMIENYIAPFELKMMSFGKKVRDSLFGKEGKQELPAVLWKKGDEKKEGFTEIGKVRIAAQKEELSGREQFVKNFRKTTDENLKIWRSFNSADVLNDFSMKLIDGTATLADHEEAMKVSAKYAEMFKDTKLESTKLFAGEGKEATKKQQKAMFKFSNTMEDRLSPKGFKGLFQSSPFVTSERQEGKPREFKRKVAFASEKMGRPNLFKKLKRGYGELVKQSQDYLKIMDKGHMNWFQRYERDDEGEVKYDEETGKSIKDKEYKGFFSRLNVFRKSRPEGMIKKAMRLGDFTGGLTDSISDKMGWEKPDRELGEEDKGSKWETLFPWVRKVIKIYMGFPYLIMLWKKREAIKVMFVAFMKKRVLPNVMFVMGKAKMVMMYALMGLLAIFLIVNFLKGYFKSFGKINEILENVAGGVFGLKTRFSSLWENLKLFFGGLWKIVLGAFTGDFGMILDGVWQTAEGLLWGLLDLLLIGAGLAFTAVVALLHQAWDWLKEPEHWEKLGRAVSSVMLVFGVWMLTRYIITSAIAYAAAIWGGWIPAVVGALVLVAALLVGYKDEIVEKLQDIWEAVKKEVKDKGGGVLAGAAAGAAAGSFIPVIGTAGGAIIGGAIGYAAAEEGGIVNSNQITLVGERGPEIAKLPQGTRIHDAKQTQKMLGDAKNNVTNNTINVHVNGRLGASDTELRNIAKKVGSMINTEINRTTSTIGGI